MSILQLEGAYENELAATGEFNPQAPKTALMLPSGQRIVLPTELLLQGLGSAQTGERAAAVGAGAGQQGPVLAAQAEGVLATGDAQRSVAAGAERKVAAAGYAADGVENDQVIPLVEEQMVVGKKEVETARVRVRRETEERIQTVSVPLTDVRWEVEHVPVEQRVEAQPEIRQVGDTMIFPLVEERVVVMRELWLREEVHVRKVKTTIEKSADFPVKRDVLVEDRG